MISLKARRVSKCLLVLYSINPLAFQKMLPLAQIRKVPIARIICIVWVDRKVAIVIITSKEKAPFCSVLTMYR
jgi:hypothetical protein